MKFPKRWQIWGYNPEMLTAYCFKMTIINSFKPIAESGMRNGILTLQTSSQVKTKRGCIRIYFSPYLTRLVLRRGKTKSVN